MVVNKFHSPMDAKISKWKCQQKQDVNIVSKYCISLKILISHIGKQWLHQWRQLAGTTFTKGSRWQSPGMGITTMDIRDPSVSTKGASPLWRSFCNGEPQWDQGRMLHTPKFRILQNNRAVLFYSTNVVKDKEEWRTCCWQEEMATKWCTVRSWNRKWTWVGNLLKSVWSL